MHEAGLLAEAVDRALRSRPPAPSAAGPDGADSGRRASPSALEVRIRDPLHVAPESVRLHAEIALRARGLTDVPIVVEVGPVTCAVCGASNDARPAHPFCLDCGLPLPRTPGPVLEASVRW